MTGCASTHAKFRSSRIRLFSSSSIRDETNERALYLVEWKVVMKQMFIFQPLDRVKKKITTDRTSVEMRVTSILFLITAAASTASRPFELSTLRPHVRFRMRMWYTRSQAEVFNALASVTRSLHQDCTFSSRGA
ncbi:hypothetical protein ALC56_06540 [Trachymyrmex septentrionalis]|uniref:Uncharacterized protein n=1 Tax=Trachymyrmex septentrionalis TaxID=34720 RepID=A0A195FGH8_9HYME|nr:hypothetical protein ALC56_06540 [Trachymyrmex septentrionalis]